MARTLLVAAALMTATADMPAVPLHNSAVPGMTIPLIGQGTGGYTGNASVPYGGGNGFPECFNGCASADCMERDPANFSGCSGYVQAAVRTW